MTTCSTDIVSEDPVESPCINLCTLDNDDVCLGCFRRLEEICAWGCADDAERRQIVVAAKARRDAGKRRG